MKYIIMVWSNSVGTIALGVAGAWLPEGAPLALALMVGLWAAGGFYLLFTGTGD